MTQWGEVSRIAALALSLSGPHAVACTVHCDWLESKRIKIAAVAPWIIHYLNATRILESIAVLIKLRKRLARCLLPSLETSSPIHINNLQTHPAHELKSAKLKLAAPSTLSGLEREGLAPRNKKKTRSLPFMTGVPCLA